MGSAICNGGQKRKISRKDYCPKCKKKTMTVMQGFYDDIFCEECGNIKGRI